MEKPRIKSLGYKELQVAIDNAKRKYDINLTEEIDRIKRDMDIKKYGYPKFWTIAKRGFNKKRVNPDLVCPMNYIFDIKAKEYKGKGSTLPMSHFFIQHELKEDRRKCKKVENLIQKYSLELNDYNLNGCKSDQYFVLREDFDQLIKDIQTTYISKNYLGLMSWLINRAFYIGAGVKSKIDIMGSTIKKNRSILLKTLYTVSPDTLLKCFKTGEELHDD